MGDTPAGATDKLNLLAKLASSGELRILIQGVYTIDQVGEAFEAFRLGTRGKLIVHVDPKRRKR